MSPIKRSFDAVSRQREIYVRGAAGLKSAIPVDFPTLEHEARKHMSPAGFDYVKTGAGREVTVANNRSAFDRYVIVPRMLRDVSDRSTEISLLDQNINAPLLLSPVGVLDLASSHGDIKVARAAENCDVPMIFSNQASESMERCSDQMPTTQKWMQIYWSRHDELVKSFIRRAEKCGCSALVFTLDTTMLGWRIRDLNNAYLPFLEGRGIAQYTSDPVFNRLLEEQPPKKQKAILGPRTLRTFWSLARNFPGNTIGNLFSGKPLRSVRQFINIYSQPALSWQHIRKAMEWTDLPIFLKGIMHPEDALRAKDLGVKGIVVSNHGGRQVDGAVSSLEALVSIRKTCGEGFRIILDSGIRGGQDIFKALALGADAVGIGRPYVYALAVGGQQGVEELLANYQAELELTMSLSGCRNISEVREFTLEKRQS